MSGRDVRKVLRSYQILLCSKLLFNILLLQSYYESMLNISSDFYCTTIKSLNPICNEVPYYSVCFLTVFI